MTLEEILKSQGLDDAAVTKIVGEMKQNKIYTASEENLDTRYNKLKTDSEGTTKQLTEAQALIEQLKKGTGDNEALQAKITDYETQKAELEKQLSQERVDNALKIGLLEAGCKDVDYVSFKLKEKGELKIDDTGKISGIAEKLTDLKTQFPTQFDTKNEGGVVEHKLETGKNDHNDGITSEQFNKMGYQDRLKLYNEHPEQYKELSGKAED